MTHKKYPTMEESGYRFISYLLNRNNIALFSTGFLLEIWKIDDDKKSYGFYFNNHFWVFERNLDVLYLNSFNRNCYNNLIMIEKGLRK